MTRTLSLIGAAAVALAACTAEPADRIEDNDVALAPALTNDADNPVAPPGAKDEAPQPIANAKANADAPADQPKATPTAAIPAQYRGRWAGGVEDCAGGANAKALMTVTDTRITMYEARGVLSKMLSASSNSFRGQFDFEGEGMTWSDPVTLTRVGDKLQRSDKSNLKFTYIRCP